MTHGLERHEPNPAALLAARGIHAGYPGRGTVLDCVSLDLVAGRRVALLGANGSGKTTLLRCLSGALKPERGDLLWQGEPLRHNRAGLTQHRQRVQLVLQDPDDQLFAADVMRDVSFGPMNLGLPHADVQHRVDDALAALEITHVAQRPIHQLSYGQRKRVAIAGALAMRPQFLLLDEPTAGLDPAGIKRLNHALDRLESSGTTVLISTHDVDAAWAWADEVAIVHAGTVQHGPAVKILTDEALVRDAGLTLPWPVRLCRMLGRDISPTCPPRTVADVAALLS